LTALFPKLHFWTATKGSKSQISYSNTSFAQLGGNSASGFCQVMPLIYKGAQLSAI
jgi:hypothetical protein